MGANLTRGEESCRGGMNAAYTDDRYIGIEKVELEKLLASVIVAGKKPLAIIIAHLTKSTPYKKHICMYRIGSHCIARKHLFNFFLRS